jgi:GMP synthase-like glutamine amidotransferase
MTERIAFLMRDKYNTPGYFWDLARENDLEPSVIKAYRDGVPKFVSADYLVLLGGPEPATKYKTYKDELILIMNELHGRETPIFGVCLGAEMVSIALGEKIKPLKREEYGWCDVEVIHADRLWPDRPSSDSYVWQWHEDYFDQPPGTKLLVTSEKVKCQAYMGEHFLCTQFHPEITADSVESIEDPKVSVYDSEENNYMYEQSRELSAYLFQLFMEMI